MTAAVSARRPGTPLGMNPVLPSVIACPLLWAAFVLLVPHGLLVFALLVVAVALGAASSAVRVRSR